MKKQLDAVKLFHETFGQENGTEPNTIGKLESVLRYNLMAEENDEYLEACVKQDLVGIADALGDKLYILCGTILKHGMQHIIEDVFDEIQASNMSKLGEDGKPILREDGKILKGENYFKPDISKFI
jgi:predicted HAD superfamily Cof-like phosphohydrolase